MILRHIPRRIFYLLEVLAAGNPRRFERNFGLEVIVLALLFAAEQKSLDFEEVAFGLILVLEEQRAFENEVLLVPFSQEYLRYPWMGIKEVLSTKGWSNKKL